MPAILMGKKKGWFMVVGVGEAGRQTLSPIRESFDDYLAAPSLNEALLSELAVNGTYLVVVVADSSEVRDHEVLCRISDAFKGAEVHTSLFLVTAAEKQVSWPAPEDYFSSIDTSFDLVVLIPSDQSPSPPSLVQGENIQGKSAFLSCLLEAAYSPFLFWGPIGVDVADYIACFRKKGIARAAVGVAACRDLGTVAFEECREQLLVQGIRPDHIVALWATVYFPEHLVTMEVFDQVKDAVYTLLPDPNNLIISIGIGDSKRKHGSLALLAVDA